MRFVRHLYLHPEPLWKTSSAEQLECLKTRWWLPCLHVLLGRCRPISNPSSAFHGDCGSQQRGSCSLSGHAIVFLIAKQNYLIRQPRSRNPPPPSLSLSLSLSLSFFLSFSFFNALQQCLGNPDSNRTHCLVILLWWSEMNRTRVSVPIKTNSKMKIFQVKLPLRVNKETANSQENKNGEVPTLKQKKTGDCVKCKRLLWIRWPPE